jgi:V/A-type H+-transporting ATPase subunit F
VSGVGDGAGVAMGSRALGEPIVVLGDSDTVLGFRLAGVLGLVCDEVDCEEKFLQSVSKEETQLVILQEELSKNFSFKTKRLVESLSKPVVISVSGKGASKGSNSLNALIKRAIGIELK